MGICASSLTEEEKAAAKKNAALNRDLNDDFKVQSGKVKLLLLGAGESGKSTLFKQMKILYSTKKGWTLTERENFAKVVYNNIIQNMKALLEACPSHTPAENQDAADEVLALKPNTAIDGKVAELLTTVWSDPGVQATWADRGDIQVQDALEYYLKEGEDTRMKAIQSPEYLPTDEDILRVRVRTSGIVEEEFTMEKTTFLMTDVGGQRNERKKWLHAFEDVHAVIFVAAISEYDQVLYEDNTTNRQTESVELFEKMCNEQWFKNSGMILFLNKSDLFREKLRHVPFKVEGTRNTDYTGKEYKEGMSDDEFEEVYADTTNYLKNLYKNQNHYPSQKEVYVYVTCATDTNQIQQIMNACKDIFLKDNLRENGFM